jgi:hypothetical protein
MTTTATNSSKMNAIMLDMEFLNTTQDAAILQIAMVALNTDTLEISPDTFYIEVDPDDCVAKGMTIGADTVRWWIHQAPEAIKSAFEKEGKYKHSLAIAMFKVGGFITSVAKPDDLTILQVGDLDSQILQTGYRLVAGDVKLPNGLAWRPWRVKCVRALRDEFANYVPTPVVKGVKHNALYDAQYQAEQYVAIIKFLRNAVAKTAATVTKNGTKALADVISKSPDLAAVAREIMTTRTPQPDDEEL